MKEISFMNAICVRKSVILKCVQLFEANRNYEYNVVNVRTYFHRQITLMVILKLYMKNKNNQVFILVIHFLTLKH